VTSTGFDPDTDLTIDVGTSGVTGFTWTPTTAGTVYTGALGGTVADGVIKVTVTCAGIVSTQKSVNVYAVTPTPITWVVTTQNGIAGSTATSTLTLTFASDPGTLTAGEFSVGGGKGGVATGASFDTQTGTARVLTLTVTGIGTGDVTYTGSANIDATPTTGNPVRLEDGGDITYGVVADGNPGASTLLTFTFSKSIDGMGLVGGDITIDPDAGAGASAGAATKGSWAEVSPNDGTKFTLGVSGTSPGKIQSTISKTGIDGTVIDGIDVY